LWGALAKFALLVGTPVPAAMLAGHIAHAGRNMQRKRMPLSACEVLVTTLQVQGEL